MVLHHPAWYGEFLLMTPLAFQVTLQLYFYILIQGRSPEQPREYIELGSYKYNTRNVAIIFISVIPIFSGKLFEHLRRLGRFVFDCPNNYRQRMNLP